MEPERLAEMTLFRDLTAEHRAELAGALREVTVEAGTELASEGDYAYKMFVIETGEAEVHKDGEFIRTLDRTATVTATTPMQLVALFMREVKQLESRAPDAVKDLRDTMTERAERTRF